jgi:hypothetical protein
MHSFIRARFFHSRVVVVCFVVVCFIIFLFLYALSLLYKNSSDPPHFFNIFFSAHLLFINNAMYLLIYQSQSSPFFSFFLFLRNVHVIFIIYMLCTL